MQRHKKSASESVLKLKNAKKKIIRLKTILTVATCTCLLNVQLLAVPALHLKRWWRRWWWWRREEEEEEQCLGIHHIQKDGNTFTLGYPKKHVTSCNNVWSIHSPTLNITCPRDRWTISGQPGNSLVWWLLYKRKIYQIPETNRPPCVASMNVANVRSCRGCHLLVLSNVAAAPLQKRPRPTIHRYAPIHTSSTKFAALELVAPGTARHLRTCEACCICSCDCRQQAPLVLSLYGSGKFLTILRSRNT